MVYLGAALSERTEKRRDHCFIPRISKTRRSRERCMKMRLPKLCSRRHALQWRHLAIFAVIGLCHGAGYGEINPPAITAANLLRYQSDSVNAAAARSDPLVQARYPAIGDFGMIDRLAHAGQKLHIVLIDESYRPVPRAGLLIQDGLIDIRVVTDEMGESEVPICAGLWDVRCTSPAFMNTYGTLMISDSESATSYVHRVHTSDTMISGQVRGDVGRLFDSPIVIAYLYDRTSATFYFSQQPVTAAGTFSLCVSTLLGGYTVVVEGWFIPADHVVVPAYENENYRYLNVRPGSRSIDFDLRAPTSVIRGACPASAHAELVRITAVEVTDSFSVAGRVWGDGSYSIDLPRGSYAVTADVRCGDSCQSLRQNVTLGIHDTARVDFNAAAATEPGDDIDKSAFGPEGLCIVTGSACRAQINFIAPITGQALLRLFDLSGRPLRIMFAGPVAKGACTLPFDAGADRLRKGRVIIAQLSITGDRRFTRFSRLATF
jgi:hypothetical protein